MRDERFALLSVGGIMEPWAVCRFLEHERKMAGPSIMSCCLQFKLLSLF